MPAIPVSMSFRLSFPFDSAEKRHREFLNTGFSKSPSGNPRNTYGLQGDLGF